MFLSQWHRVLSLKRNEYAELIQEGNNQVIEARENASNKFSKRWMLFFCVTLAVVLLPLAGFIGGLKLASCDCNRELNQGVSLLPPVEMNTAVTFTPNYLFWNMSDSRSTQAWAPLGHEEYIFVKDAKKYQLGPGAETNNTYEGYPISVSHQLHCLKILRIHHASFLTSNLLDDKDSHHPDHCFDYLRQAITCNADMTLEQSTVYENGYRVGTNGWGTTHQCKNWVQVENVMLKYRWRYAF